MPARSTRRDMNKHVFAAAVRLDEGVTLVTLCAILRALTEFSVELRIVVPVVEAIGIVDQVPLAHPRTITPEKVPEDDVVRHNNHHDHERKNQIKWSYAHRSVIKKSVARGSPLPTVGHYISGSVSVDSRAR